MSNLPRIIIENVIPEIDRGQYYAKSAINQRFYVEADIFHEGQETIQACIKYKRASSSFWKEEKMSLVNNDYKYQGYFVPEFENEFYIYTIETWIEPLETFFVQLDLKLQNTNNFNFYNELEKFAKLAYALQSNTNNREDKLIVDDYIKQSKELLAKYESKYKKSSLEFSPVQENCEIHQEIINKLQVISQDNKLKNTREKYPLKTDITTYYKELGVFALSKKAMFSSWYEFFPRSFGKFTDCYEHIDYVADLGFDVIYLPPIHPIGSTNRKGKNNSLQALPGDKGSPWAIGGYINSHYKGGHKEIHPDLGTLDDFTSLIQYANKHHIDVAMDIAFQCSPDHPYVDYYPHWFTTEADGTIQYAQNPPKKYQDIYPFDFYNKDKTRLWDELKSIVCYWADKGIKIFRVDNPHTKPLNFWKWLIYQVQQEYPGTVFLSEAFTKPNKMEYLSKVGFTQSYSYFTWLEDKKAFIEYFTKLTSSPLKDYFIANLFTNTPDILSKFLQTGGINAFKIQVILASTLSSSYGIYSGFELCENTALNNNSEEYLDSEKYQIKYRNYNQQSNIQELIKKLNTIRKENSAFQHYKNLEFLNTHSKNILAYAKYNDDRTNIIITCVNISPTETSEDELLISQELLTGWGVSPDSEYQVEDLLTSELYTWSGNKNYIKLSPDNRQAHILRVNKQQ